MESEGKCQAENQKRRSALYVDGFNLYHPIKDFNEGFLKWIDLWRLGEIIIPKHDEELVLVKYFTAKRNNSEAGSARHATYINALKQRGVITVLGHYIVEPKFCGSCGDRINKYTEKQTDINLALDLVFDALDDRFDHAYLLSADSDQAATARTFKKRFPHKRLTSVLPPDRPASDKIMQHADAKIQLNKSHIERVVMPSFVPGKTGLIRRPTEYDPPLWWVHPDQRQK